MNVSNLTRIELAGLIGQTLTDHGIDAVLSGGSCVSIYSNERWVSLTSVTPTKRRSSLRYTPLVSPIVGQDTNILNTLTANLPSSFQRRR